MNHVPNRVPDRVSSGVPESGANPPSRPVPSLYILTRLSSIRNLGRPLPSRTRTTQPLASMDEKRFGGGL